MQLRLTYDQIRTGSESLHGGGPIRSLQSRIRRGVTKGVAQEEEEMCKEENAKDRGRRARDRERRSRPYGRNSNNIQSTKRRDLTIVYNEWSNSKGFANRFEWVCATEAII